MSTWELAQRAWHARREAQLELKVRLLRAALDRAERYDPEWGPDPEDRPLGYVVGAENRIKAKASSDPWVSLSYILAEGIKRSMFISNSYRVRWRYAPGASHDGGKSIIVPLNYGPPREIP